MSQPLTKAQLIAMVRQVRDELEQLLAAADPARLETEPVVGDWTAKDVVAHLAAWRWLSVARLEAALRGEPPESPWPEFPDPDADVEAVNAMVAAASRNRSLAEVLADSRETFARMEDALQALPEDALVEPGRFPWLGSWPLAAVVEGMVEHWAVDHAPDLRRLARSGRAGETAG